MGTFRYTIEIGDQQGQRWETVEALVDTGATYTTLPISLLERIGISAIESQRFTLADGREVDLEVGFALAGIDGRTRPTVVVFSTSDNAILGAVTLEEFGLAVDPVARRLIRVPALLM